jgi:NAD(P)-dependent dehydrogenase (short-subunit alcohol dehydrogenase family)
MTKVSALERARYGVDVKGVLPSYLPTELNEVFSAAEARRAHIKRPLERCVAQLDEFARTLLGRAGSFVTRHGAAVNRGRPASGL